MNIFNIKKAFEMMKERNWDTLYVVLDLHGTIIKPDDKGNETWYEGAEEVIKWFNQRKDIKIILWTSSWPSEIHKFLNSCYEKKITFDCINDNPFEKSSPKTYVEDKFYFNILLDDRAGFEGETDWKLIKKELIDIGEWDKV